MCGLWGWQWKDNSAPTKGQRRALMAELAGGMDQRGGQSWGVWTPNLVLRGMGKAKPHTHRYDGVFSGFGHSRWATHGANTIENTHPFIKDGTALSHNGVISNHRDLNSRYSRGHTVDSQHLLSHLLEAKPFTEIEAYGAICWTMPSEPGSIYMGTLATHGDLFIAQTDFGVVWASTEACVRAALKAAQMALKIKYVIQPGEAYFAKDGTLFVDGDFPSILVTTPSYQRHWSSYGDGGTSYTGTYGRDHTYWCNMHKKRYTGCPCRASDPHVFQVSGAQVALLKDGDEYKVPAPTPTAPAGGKAYVPYFCQAKDCMAKAPCPVHQPQQASAASAIADADAQLQFCPAIGCIAMGPCPAGTAHTYPKQLSAEARTAIATASQEDRALWDQLAQSNGWAAQMQSEADAEEQAKAEYDAMVDLAELWLEAEHQITPAMTNGMTRAQILELAVEEGFDMSEAEAEAIEITEVEETNAPIASSNVQQSPPQHEPANWGAIVPVGGRSDN